MAEKFITIGGMQFPAAPAGTVIQPMRVNEVAGTVAALPIPKPGDITRELIPFVDENGEGVVYDMPAGWDFSSRLEFGVGVKMWIRRGYDALAGRTSYTFGPGLVPDTAVVASATAVTAEDI